MKVDCNLREGSVIFGCLRLGCFLDLDRALNDSGAASPRLIARLSSSFALRSLAEIGFFLCIDEMWSGV